MAMPSPSVDIWSVGCIMAELLQGKALFPGSDCILGSGWGGGLGLLLQGGGRGRWAQALASSAPNHATLGSLSPVAGEQGLGSDPRSGVWDPRRVHAWLLDLS